MRRFRPIVYDTNAEKLIEQSVACVLLNRCRPSIQYSVSWPPKLVVEPTEPPASNETHPIGLGQNSARDVDSYTVPWLWQRPHRLDGNPDV